MNRVTLKIVEYENTFNSIISKTTFLHLIMQIIRNLQSNFRMQSAALTALQLVAEIYIITFLADMITFYLSLQLITHLSLSATNLAVHHAGCVTLMKKNFL